MSALGWTWIAAGPLAGVLAFRGLLVGRVVSERVSTWSRIACRA
jgi:hypothetical protein